MLDTILEATVTFGITLFTLINRIFMSIQILEHLKDGLQSVTPASRLPTRLV